MDTSEKYIKMCEAAQEIQNLSVNKNNKKLQDQDYVCHTCSIYEDGYVVMSGLSAVVSFFNSKEYKSLIWLPRQDQLQEIILDKIDVFEIDSFLFHLIEYTKEEQPWYSSFEQLLLGYVMRFNFNKIWDGKNEKWI